MEQDARHEAIAYLVSKPGQGGGVRGARSGGRFDFGGYDLGVEIAGVLVSIRMAAFLG